jgi:dinuclear metal center YbgI/SA1388 family protein
VLRLADVIAVLEELYDPAWAESWDAVGLVCGDPDADVGRVLFAVDPVATVVDEAFEWPADLIVSHHPLFLRPVHGVPATTPKGRMVHRLVAAGVALHVVHTNADSADPGVSDALAAALGLVDLRALDPASSDPVGEPIAEPRAEPRPALPGRRGLGRLGRLPEPESLDAFVERAAAALPSTAAGLRVAGDHQREISTVAVCGGAGDFLLDIARLVHADVYLTADLRHHRASESLEAGGPALVDVAHWATEWPWLADAARRLADQLGAHGATVDTRVSSTVTDPWTAIHVSNTEPYTRSTAPRSQR